MAWFVNYHHPASPSCSWAREKKALWCRTERTDKMGYDVKCKMDRKEIDETKQYLPEV
jgi:hypothetical protein